MIRGGWPLNCIAFWIAASIKFFGEFSSTQFLDSASTQIVQASSSVEYELSLELV